MIALDKPTGVDLKDSAWVEKTIRQIEEDSSQFEGKYEVKTVHGAKFLWDVGMKKYHHTLDTILPALSNSFAEYKAKIEQERYEVHEHNKKVLNGEMPAGTQARNVPRLRMDAFGQYFCQENVLKHSRFFRLVKGWWPNRDSRHSFVWKEEEETQTTVAAAAPATGGGDYFSSYKHYTTTMVKVGKTPSSPKAQITSHYSYGEGAFAGANCYFGDRAIPLSVQGPDTEKLANSPPTRSSQPSSPSSEEVASMLESVRGLRLSDISVDTSHDDDNDDVDDARNVGNFSSFLFNRGRLSDVTKGTDSSYEAEASQGDVSLSEDLVEQDFELVEKVVWVKDFFAVKKEKDADMIHVLGLNALNNVPVTLTLSKKSYGSARNHFIVYVDGKEIDPEAMDDFDDVVLLYLEGKPRDLDLDKMVVLVKWQNEGESLTGWRWYPHQNVLKGFEHPSFGSGVEAGDIYEPDDSDKLFRKGLIVFGPRRETSDEEEGFFCKTSDEEDSATVPPPDKSTKNKQVDSKENHQN